MSMTAPIQTHYRACNLCEAICGLVIKTQGNEILSIKGDKNDPLSQGHICPKALALKDVYYDEDRLKQPVKRTVNGWQTISWEEAYDTVVQRLKAIQTQYGRDSIGVYLGNPNAHNFGAILANPSFIRALRTKNRFSATSADQLPHHFAGRFMFGHFFFLPVPDVDRTDYMLIVGGNPLASNGSLMTAPNIEKRLKAIQKRGGQFVVIDPRKTETAKKASEHIFIKPGTDVLLLLAMVQVIVEEGWMDLGKLADFTDGVESVKELTAGYTPEKVAVHTGIDSATIRRLAKDFATAERAVCYGRMGVSTQAFGGLCIWLVNVLNIITGNLDRAGGVMFPKPAFDITANGSVGKYHRWKSRVSQHPEVFGELPVAVMAEEILTEGEGQIKAMVTLAGNPILSTPNGMQLDKAFEQLEFMVAVDIYINETTHHADIILPPATGLETAHYDATFHNLAIRNTAKYSEPVFPKTAEQRYDYEILGELTHRLRNLETVNTPTPEQILDMGLRMGLHKKTGISLEKLKSNPSGIDLGALTPCLPHRLFTRDKRIQLAPPEITKDMARVEKTFFKETTNNHLLLIGRRHLRSNNSWLHNSHRLVKGKNRCTLMIHPNDAKRLDVVHQQPVKIHSRVGMVEIVAEVTSDIMEGVVSIPHGWGHNREGNQMTIAQAHAGVSINDLTDEKLIDELTGNAAFSGVPVVVVSDI